VFLLLIILIYIRINSNLGSFINERNNKENNIYFYWEEKNDKTISIDQFDAWTYTSPVCKVSQNANDEWNCAYTNIPLTQFVTMSTPRELIARVTPEVEEVKYLAKTM
jgi:hypothetical protein